MVPAKIAGWVDHRDFQRRLGGDRRRSETVRLDREKGRALRREVLDWLYLRRWWPWVLALPLIAIAYGADMTHKISLFFVPVVRMQGELVSRTPDAAIIHMWGQRLRGTECEYRDIMAFGDRAVGLPVDLYITRKDKDADNKTRPTGEYDIGLWEVRPLPGVIAVRVFSMHDCGGRLVATKIAEVKLP